MRSKELGQQPFSNGTKVYVLDYVFSGKQGIIMAREDSNDADSYTYFVYQVAVDGCGIQFLNEFQVRASE